MVRISLCSPPLSPMAFRAALIRVASVEIRDDAAAPDSREQIVLADDAIAILDEIAQKIKDLRLHGD